VLSDHKQKIADYFSLENPSAGYVYDFGDNWEHTVKLPAHRAGLLKDFFVLGDFIPQTPLRSHSSPCTARGILA